jgi:hypothetical protein
MSWGSVAGGIRLPIREAMPIRLFFGFFRRWPLWRRSLPQGFRFGRFCFWFLLISYFFKRIVAHGFFGGGGAGAGFSFGCDWIFICCVGVACAGRCFGCPCRVCLSLMLMFFSFLIFSCFFWFELLFRLPFTFITNFPSILGVT